MSSSVGTFRDVLSGKKRGVVATLLRMLLFPLSIGYRWGVALRNHLYNRGLRSVRRVDAVVISVGNLTTGGTGKTPLVETLARMLRESGVRVAVVSRGYKRKRGRDSDEKLLLVENLPDVPHVIHANRVAAAREAVAKFDAQVVLMDDGFQHRRLARDLDVVTVDATNPFGYGHLLPRGLLREPVRSLRRADVVVITRTRLVPPQEPPRLEATIREIAPHVLVVHAEDVVLGLRKPDGDMLPASDLRGTRVVAFCGIGNPDAFRGTLNALGTRVEAFFAFGDHHRYRTRDLETVDAQGHIDKADAIVTTQKDVVRIDPGFHWHRELLVVRMECRLTRGKEAFEERIRALVAARRDASTPSPSGRGSG